MVDWKEDLYYLPKDIESMADNLKGVGNNFLAVGNQFMKDKLYSLAFSLMNLADKSRYIKNKVFEFVVEQEEKENV